MTGPGSTGSGAAPDHGSGEAACPTDIGPAVTERETEAAELAALLARAADGDTGSFAELYDRTCARVYGMVLRVLRDPGFAEETTQEVYLQLWRTADAFDATRGSAVSWLMTLAHRRAVDRVRSEQSHSNREVVYESRNRGSEFDQVAEEVSGRLDRQAVIDCLGSLTPVQRESVSLAYYGGRTYREVATQLGVALPTIKTRIRDGLVRLRGCLGVEW
ncbi:sigma-70 family RNA polymerase sigma factor [Rhodococcus daqingensis]|uniref:Sigma-70 family RNA polymerase sigma factor n=1 Tax=Rhodococcus daqingensis TaxID=2479363 RepID=A0ABW2RW26_9NOCA